MTAQKRRALLELFHQMMWLAQRCRAQLEGARPGNGFAWRVERLVEIEWALARAMRQSPSKRAPEMAELIRRVFIGGESLDKVARQLRLARCGGGGLTGAKLRTAAELRRMYPGILDLAEAPLEWDPAWDHDPDAALSENGNGRRARAKRNGNGR